MKGAEFFTFDEVKKYLKINRSTLYKFVQEGRIPAVKVGRQWRFDLSEINHYLKQQSRNYNSDRIKHTQSQKAEESNYGQTVEKRAFFRLNKQFPVKYSLLDNPEKTFKATARNISEGGLFIEAESFADKSLPAVKLKKKRLSFW